MKKRNWKKQLSLLALGLFVMGTVMTSCQREACPGAITMDELAAPAAEVVEEDPSM